MRLTEDDAARLLQQPWRQGGTEQRLASDGRAFSVSHKFNAKPQVHDGIRFDSKLEGQYYEHLKLLQKAGEVVFFLRQTVFHLPGGTKYSVDFQVFRADGTVSFVDVKGQELPEFIRAKKQVEAIYPVTIEVVKKGDF